MPNKVCFAYLDFDFYEPTLAGLRFLDDKLEIGGHILVDDYGFFSSGAKTAVDEFTKENKNKYIISHDQPKNADEHCYDDCTWCRGHNQALRIARKLMMNSMQCVVNLSDKLRFWKMRIQMEEKAMKEILE